MGKTEAVFPAQPRTAVTRAEWAAATFHPRSVLEAVSWDSIRSELEGAACTASWGVPARIEDNFAPEGLSQEFPFGGMCS